MKSRKNSSKFKVGQKVRIRKWQNIFDKGYKQKFSTEYYIINRVFDHLPTITYELKAMDDNEIIEGGFYANEIQLVRK